MSKLSLVVAPALLVFLAMRSRRNPLFLAGAGAYFALGRSIYIDIAPGSVLLTVSTLTVTGSDVLFFAMFLGWLYALWRRPARIVRLAPLWVAVGAVLLFFLALEFALATASASELHPVLILATRSWFYIPLGFLMTLDVLRRFTRDEVAEYIGVLSLFTACLSVLYIASALNLHVYPYPKNLPTSVGGQTVIRDFATIPLWVGLAWCHYLSQPKKGARTYVAMLLLATGVLLTYTRSLVGLLVVTALLATISFTTRRGRFSNAMALGTACTVLVTLAVAVGPLVAPKQYDYLMGRFGQRGTSLNVSRDPNAQSRLRQFEWAQAAGGRVSPYLGAGLFDSSPAVNGGQYESSDGDWIGIVYRTGWSGIVVLAVPIVVAFWRGIRSLVRGAAPGTAATLVLIGSLATVWYAGLRTVSPVYLWWPTVSLFSVSLVAYAEALPRVAAGATRGRTESESTTRRGLLGWDV